MKYLVRRVSRPRERFQSERDRLNNYSVEAKEKERLVGCCAEKEAKEKTANKGTSDCQKEAHIIEDSEAKRNGRGEV